MLRIIKLFAYIDFVLGLVLALPFAGVFVVQLLHGLLTSEPLTIDAYHSFLMKILGVMVILWAMVRIQHTATWQVNYDCVARLFVLSNMIYFCYNGLTVLVFFVVVELLGLYQWFAQKNVSCEN